MIDVFTGHTFTGLLLSAPTGLVGTLTAGIEELDGTVVSAQSTADITEVTTGRYEAVRTAPDIAGTYVLKWVNGSVVAEEDLNVEPVSFSETFLSLQDLSDYLGRDVTDDNGALIAVDSACEVVRTLTEQDFSNVSSDTIHLDGSGTDTVLLPQVPVTGAGTVVVNGGTLEADDYTFTEEGHLIRTDGTAVWSTWGQTCAPWAYWPQGRQNIEVTYDHGYAGGTVPSDLRMVALMIAYRMVTQGGASSEQIGNTIRSYAVSSTDLTANELRILRKYRRPQ